MRLAGDRDESPDLLMGGRFAHGATQNGRCATSPSVIHSAGRPYGSIWQNETDADIFDCIEATVVAHWEPERQTA